MDEVGEALDDRRTTVPRRAIDAAARDDAVYLNIELIGGARVREVARYEPSLQMRIINTATQDTTVTDAVSATAKALGTLLGVASLRPDTAGFDEMLRWGQKAVVTWARDARSKAQT